MTPSKVLLLFVNIQNIEILPILFAIHTSTMPSPGPPTIATRDLSYAFPDGSKGLQDISLDLPANARCLLIGGKQYSHFSLCIVC